MPRELLSINRLFGDPIENPTLRISDNNPFVGYYGFVRGLGLTIHSGFDYEAISKPALATFNAKNINVGVYIGRPGYNCTLRNNYEENSFEYDICKKCALKDEIKRHCYGIRLFLTDKKCNLSIMYAHLSRIDERVYKTLKKQSDYEYLGVLSLEIGQPVGVTGNTGIAYKMIEENKTNSTEQQHLHFECSINGRRVIPNNAVGTKYTIMEILFDGLLIGKNVWKPLEEVPQNKWKDFFSNHADEIKKGQYRIGVDSFSNSSLSYYQ
jgi:hypothetical protein